MLILYLVAFWEDFIKKKGRVVVITGASAGVGRATACAFAKQGASIGLLARDLYRLKETQQEVEKLGGKALIFSVDVANADQVEEATERIEKELGPIDVWINNAMVSVFSPAKEMAASEYKRVTEVTYLGYVHGTLSALRRMLLRNRGVIIQVGSALAYRSIPLQSAYCAAKHAVKGFTDSIRCELLHDKSQIKITMVQMPALNTPQFNWVKSRLERKPQPVPPIFQPEVAAKAILWATDHYRSVWFLGFSTIIASLVNKIAPQIGDWYLARKGYIMQQYNGPDQRDRPFNLYEPVRGNYAAHGDFDKRSASRSIQFWLSKQRNKLMIAGALVILFLAFLKQFLQQFERFF